MAIFRFLANNEPFLFDNADSIIAPNAQGDEVILNVGVSINDPVPNKVSSLLTTIGGNRHETIDRVEQTRTFTTIQQTGGDALAVEEFIGSILRGQIFSYRQFNESDPELTYQILNTTPTRSRVGTSQYFTYNFTALLIGSYNAP
jgi:hypothetical protein